MNKIFSKALVSLILCVSLLGCVSNEGQIRPDVSEAGVAILSRHIGLELQKQYPTIANPIKNICNEIVATIQQNQPVSTVYTNKIIDILLTDDIDNRMLILDIIDLINMLKINPDIHYLPEDKIKLINIIATNLLIGLKGI